jgi:hypothetical protein
MLQRRKIDSKTGKFIHRQMKVYCMCLSLSVTLQAYLPVYLVIELSELVFKMFDLCIRLFHGTCSVFRFPFMVSIWQSLPPKIRRVNKFSDLWGSAQAWLKTTYGWWKVLLSPNHTGHAINFMLVFQTFWSLLHFHTHY